MGVGLAGEEFRGEELVPLLVDKASLGCPWLLMCQSWAHSQSLRGLCQGGGETRTFYHHLLLCFWKGCFFYGWHFLCFCFQEATVPALPKSAFKERPREAEEEAGRQRAAVMRDPVADGAEVENKDRTTCRVASGTVGNQVLGSGGQWFCCDIPPLGLPMGCGLERLISHLWLLLWSAAIPPSSCVTFLNPTPPYSWASESLCPQLCQDTMRRQEASLHQTPICLHLEGGLPAFRTVKNTYFVS